MGKMSTHELRSLETFMFPVRTENALRTAGLKTVEDVQRLGRRGLAALPNMMPHNVRGVLVELTSAGFGVLE